MTLSKRHNKFHVINVRYWRQDVHVFLRKKHTTRTHTHTCTHGSREEAHQTCNRVFRDIPTSSMVLGTNYPISITREIQFVD